MFSTPTSPSRKEMPHDHFNCLGGGNFRETGVGVGKGISKDGGGKEKQGQIERNNQSSKREQTTQNQLEIFSAHTEISSETKQFNQMTFQQEYTKMKSGFHHPHQKLSFYLVKNQRTVNFLIFFSSFFVFILAIKCNRKNGTQAGFTCLSLPTYSNLPTHPFLNKI